MTERVTDDGKTITPCGGCGETDTNKRCIGCMHVFFEGDWPEAYRDRRRAALASAVPADKES